MVVNAPVMRISNIRSGILNDAKKISNCSLSKYPDRTRYRKKPEKLVRTIINDKSKAEEKMLVCLEKIKFEVFLINFSISFYYSLMTYFLSGLSLDNGNKMVFNGSYMVFFGEYQVNLSGSGRFVLPKRIRELIKGNTFILTKGFDNSLAGYDREDWEKRAADLLNPSLLQPSDLKERRGIFSALSYLEIDEQGRFVIPKNLLGFADIKDEAVIIGVGDHFEIWDSEKWKEYNKKSKIK